MSNDFDAESMLSRFIDESSSLIDAEALKAVRHYQRHDEYEMSFEGLVIELMRKGVYPKDFNVDEWVRVGQQYNLDKEAVFERDFWSKFLDWGSAYQQR